MDQKMKNFDRSIEHMMNENAVTPPFGMWNRISAELDAQAITHAPAGSPIPQRSLTGMVIGALIISASLVTAYVVNSNTANKELQATTVTVPSIVAPVATSPAVSPVVIQDQPVVSKEVKHHLAAYSSKPKTIAKPVEETIIPAEETSMLSAKAASSNDVEVLVPIMQITPNAETNETYYFPAVDMYTGENKKAETKAIAKVVKTEKSAEREVTSSSEPRIKFHPKRHSKHNYGVVNRMNSRRK